jgi:hypothetical protein
MLRRRSRNGSGVAARFLADICRTMLVRLATTRRRSSALWHPRSSFAVAGDFHQRRDGSESTPKT